MLRCKQKHRDKSFSRWDFTGFFKCSQSIRLKPLPRVAFDRKLNYYCWSLPVYWWVGCFVLRQRILKRDLLTYINFEIGVCCHIGAVYYVYPVKFQLEKDLAPCFCLHLSIKLKKKLNSIPG